MVDTERVDLWLNIDTDIVQKYENATSCRSGSRNLSEEDPVTRESCGAVAIYFLRVLTGVGAGSRGPLDPLLSYL